uniref:CRM1_C domain-containing protein n=1 Tax=Syphacia muris TaxID=451379 RepID=A0A0N5A8H4_9BILA
TFTDEKIKTELCLKLRIWFDRIRNNCLDEIPSKYIDLAYHVVKKNWKMLKDNQQESILLLRTLLELNVKVLMTSQDSSLAHRSAVVLSTMLKNFVEDNIFLDLMQEIAQPVLSVAFSRLQVEMIRSVVSSLAEILMYYTRKYPMETRQYLNALPHGGEILDCLKEAYNLKNFKHMIIVFNSTMRQKDAAS